MRQKRLLFLGGSFFQLPPILYAKQQGHYVITCDYLPGNPGHQYANEYHNVSTTDMKGVLRLAQQLRIDGIVAYGSDPAAATAAYVAGHCHLPGNPYESVCLLARKDLYRDFLRKHHFNVPFSGSFSSLAEAEAYFIEAGQPVVIKPVDSSGSKGVFKVNTVGDLRNVFDNSMAYSRSKKVILEQYIVRKGYQIAGDGFVANGKLVFRCFAQEHFVRSGNPFSPVGESYPLQLPEALQEKIHREIDRLVSLLYLKAGALNFDIMLNRQDDVYLMEVGPRAGGHLITEMIRHSTGVDLVKYVIASALGEDCSGLAMYAHADYYAFRVFFAESSGIFRGVTIHPSLLDHIVERKLFVQEGNQVQSVKNSSGILGCMIMKFDTPEDMLEKMESMHELIKVRIDSGQNP